MMHKGYFGSMIIFSTALACPAGLAATPYAIVVASATSSPPSSAPSSMASLPAGPPALKLIGGGGRTNFSGLGSLLTTLDRSGIRNWSASAKDHLSPDPATVTSYVLGITDPMDDWEVMEFSSAPSYAVNHPVATATLPRGMGWILLGGACWDNWAPTGAAGNMLTASFPSSTTSWECRGKDHSVASPAAMTAMVFGMRLKPGRVGIPAPRVIITTATSTVAELPEAVAPALPGALVTGGGALAMPADPNGWGQLLTGTYPEIDEAGAIVGWHASSKDHLVASPGTVTAYAINLVFKSGAAAGEPSATGTPPPMVASLGKSSR